MRSRVAVPSWKMSLSNQGDLVSELFGDISDLSDDQDWPSHHVEQDPGTPSILVHPTIAGLRARASPLPQCIVKPLLPHLHALFDPQNGANQAMRFGSNLPAFLEPLCAIAQQLLPAHLSARSPSFDQMIANLYCPGEGIIPHIDLARFEDGIVIFSFLSPLVMDFQRVDTTQSLRDGYKLVSNNGSDVSHAVSGTSSIMSVGVLLEPGSAICLSGESRYAWTHGITERLSDSFEGRDFRRGKRISITLRKMKPNQSESGIYILEDSGISN